MGDEFETVQGNGTDKDYKVNEHEQNFVHLRLQIPEYDTHTGKPISNPFVQMYTVREFEQADNIGGFAQYKVEVLHDPRKDAAQPVKRDYEPGNKADEAELQRRGLMTDSNTIGGFTPVTPLAPVDINSGERESQPEQPAKVDWDKGYRKGDYQKHYETLYGEAANEDLTIADLKTAIEAHEA